MKFGQLLIHSLCFVKKMNRIWLLVVLAIVLVACQAAPTPTPVCAPSTATPTQRAGATAVLGCDCAPMVFVPAGEFTMGRSGFERPPHIVYLDAFWIDKYEVTNALYRRCADIGRCQPPSSTKTFTRETYYGDSRYDNFPVIYVSWDDAIAFCAWAGKRLPTEAEWEKAARGTDGRVYPWGNDWDPAVSNTRDSTPRPGDTTAVGSYPAGASPYGALDMGGNVWEWVVDWYDWHDYDSSQLNNPKGPASGIERVVRGGSFFYVAYDARVDVRFAYRPEHLYDGVGFRCAR